jgi:protein TonB
MTNYRLFIAIGVSAACHAAMLLPGWSYTPASAMPRRGDSAVTLDLVASVEAAARPAPEQTRPVTELKREVRRQVENAAEQLAAALREVSKIKLPDPPKPPEPQPPVELTPPEPVVEPVIEAAKVELRRSATDLAEQIKTAAEQLHQATRECVAQQAKLAAEQAKQAEQARQTAILVAAQPPSPKSPPQQTRPDGDADVNSIASNGGSGTRGVSGDAQAVGALCPIYPPICRRRGEEGKVTLEWQVLAGGKCGQVRIVQSSGFDLLDQAAIEAVKNASFRPAVSAARAVDSTMACTFRFTLTDQGY